MLQKHNNNTGNYCNNSDKHNNVDGAATKARATLRVHPDNFMNADQ